MKIGLYFGSFNPIHLGHLIVAQSLLNNSSCDRVWFVISPQNPHKDKRSLLNEHDRLLMAELATQDNHRLVASNVEFMLPRPSYTIDTLGHLAARYPTYEFCLLMGADNLQHLHKWKKYEAIINYYSIFVYPRPGALAPPELEHPNIQLIDAPFLDISSTRIREMIRKKQSIQYLTPAPVLEFIQSRNLYAY